jgi:hypothetical protein
MERLSRLDREREHLLIAIQVVKNEGGEWNESAAAASDSGGVEASRPSPAGPAQQVRRVPEIRPDTFFGLSQHQAARRYLQGLGHADRLEGIYKAITTGGIEIGGASPLETLRATLAKDSAVFVRVSPGTFGLREFYPQLGNKSEPRIRGRRAKPAKKPKARKARQKAVPKPAVKEKTPAPEQED